MIEMTNRITNLTSAILLLFQIVSRESVDLNKKILEKNDSVFCLEERPGLQNITYISIVDES